MEAVLELIEKSDYIYSRKAFDKCPLPVLIVSTTTSIVEYVNEEFDRVYGNLPAGTQLVDSPQSGSLSISRIVGSHEIRIFLCNQPDGLEEITSWLARVSKPLCSSDLQARTKSLGLAMESFLQVVNPLIRETSPYGEAHFDRV